MIQANPIQMTICPKHNIEVKSLSPNKQSEQLACLACIQEQDQKSSKNNNGTSMLENFMYQIKQNLTLMNSVIQTLISIKETTNKTIEELINEIKNQILFYDSLEKDITTNTLDQEHIQQQHYQYIKSQTGFQKNLILQIEMIKQRSAFDQIVQYLNEMDLKILNYEKKEKSNRFQYQLVAEQPSIYFDLCFAISCNKDASIVIIGDRYSIYIFELKNGVLKQVQELTGHESYITNLQFMNKSNSFISGSQDSTIKTWQKVDNKWVNIETLLGHNNFIICLIVSQNEDCIISGDNDKLIIFWRWGSKKVWKIDTQIQCQSDIYSLSLNDSNNKLIVSQNDNSIQVFEKKGSKWNITQKIQVKCFGCRLCFLSDKEFVFLPYCGENINIYNFNQKSQQFEIVQEIDINYGEEESHGFPIQFIKSQNLLLVKNSNHLNILRKLQNNIFKLDQSIKFNSCNIHGCVSDDGQYLLTQNRKTKEISIRKLMIGE